MNQPLILATAFVGPFVQEDAAIFGAVSVFLHPTADQTGLSWGVLLAMTAGLIISDLWKYWIGFAARSGGWTARLADKPAVKAVTEKLLAHPGKTLLIARFVPGTRIPAYIASGYFGLNFGRFAFWIVVSALAYIGVAAMALSTLGAVAGPMAQLYVGVALVGAFIVLAAGKMLAAKYRQA